MSWYMKSFSDTDEVWVEVDHEGNETGQARYLRFDPVTGQPVWTTPEELAAELPDEPGLPESFRPSGGRKQTALVIATSAGVVAAIELVRRLVG